MKKNPSYTIDSVSNHSLRKNKRNKNVSVQSVGSLHFMMRHRAQFPRSSCNRRYLSQNRVLRTGLGHANVELLQSLHNHDHDAVADFTDLGVLTCPLVKKYTS